MASVRVRTGFLPITIASQPTQTFLAEKDQVGCAVPLGRLGDIVQTIEKAVDAGIFYPVESAMNCSTCSYRQPCREWGRPSENAKLIQLNIKSAEAKDADRTSS